MNAYLMLENSLVQELSDVNSKIYESLVTFTSDMGVRVVGNHAVQLVTPCISMHMFQWSAGIQCDAVSS